MNDDVAVYDIVDETSCRIDRFYHIESIYDIVV
jgi:hypothetical protein